MSQATIGGDGYKTVVWSASTTSQPIEIQPGRVFALYLPGSFVTAQISFQAEAPDGTWETVSYNGAVLATNITPGNRNVLPVEVFALAGGRIKIVSNASVSGNGRLYVVK
jgi:hypothetical protein